jgi:hypothetical protein
MRQLAGRQEWNVGGGELAQALLSFPSNAEVRRAEETHEED